jgi:serine/threonine protein kinase
MSFRSRSVLLVTHTHFDCEWTLAHVSHLSIFSSAVQNAANVGSRTYSRFRMPPSAKYARLHYLNYDDLLLPSSPFADAGRTPGAREIIIVDAVADPTLVECLEAAKSLLSKASDERERALILARFVSSQFGGHESKSLEEDCENVLRLMRECSTEKPFPLLIGTMIGQVGVCRHRAILFKFIADQTVIKPAEWGNTPIRCRLIRGQLRSVAFDAAHAWNVVRVGSKDMLVDLMAKPDLFEEGSAQANLYARCLYATKHFGASSIHNPMYITWNQLSDMQPFGSGGFSELKLATLTHVVPTTQKPITRRVVVKVPRALMTEYDEKLFKAEIQVLSSLSHPNIVELVGACVNPTSDSPKYAIVTEYVRGGNLFNFLRSNPTIAMVDRVRFLLQIAEAISYFHAAGLVHRDIKPGNILIELFESNDKTEGAHSAHSKSRTFGAAKLCDFGLARFVRADSISKSIRLSGTPNYMAPEQFKNESIGLPADIYQFGGLMYFTLTGREPWSEMNDNHYAIPMAVCGNKSLTLRPDDEKNAPARFIALMRACLNPLSGKRPLASALCQELRCILDDLLTLEPVVSIDSEPWHDGVFDEAMPSFGHGQSPAGELKRDNIDRWSSSSLNDHLLRMGLAESIACSRQNRYPVFSVIPFVDHSQSLLVNSLQHIIDARLTRRVSAAGYTIRGNTIVRRDGNCMFDSIADQIYLSAQPYPSQLSDNPSAEWQATRNARTQEVRERVAEWLFANADFKVWF